MELRDQVLALYTKAKSYPELAKGFLELGMLSYTVEVSSGICLYRFSEGKQVIHRSGAALRKVSVDFSGQATINAIRNNQQGRSTYPQFMDEIASAGVLFYEATLTGERRVTYIGRYGDYTEKIPI
jgi:uncharacterized protein YbcV (DUF1398 family)